MDYGIKRRRELADWSLRELAARAGISPGHLSKIEHGTANPSDAVLTRVAKALGVGLSDLKRSAVMTYGDHPNLPDSIDDRCIRSSYRHFVLFENPVNGELPVRVVKSYQLLNSDDEQVKHSVVVKLNLDREHTSAVFLSLIINFGNNHIEEYTQESLTELVHTEDDRRVIALPILIDARSKVSVQWEAHQTLVQEGRELWSVLHPTDGMSMTVIHPEAINIRARAHYSQPHLFKTVVQSPRIKSWEIEGLVNISQGIEITWGLAQ